MADYRKKSLKFLYDVMRGSVKEHEPILDKTSCTIELVEKPVAVESRMKAAERILKYYTDQDRDPNARETGIVILAKEEFNKDIDLSDQDS